MTITTSPLISFGRTAQGRVVSLGRPFSYPSNTYARPRLTVAPVISGLTTVGSVITCSAGTWDPTGVISYRWKSGDVDTGITTNTYTVLAGDQGNVVTCRVTNTVGNLAAATNATIDIPITPIITPSVYSYTTPAVGGPVAPGDIIHADNVINKLNVSHIDLNGKDISATINTITTGDYVEVGATIYTVQAPAQGFTGYSAITIDPTTQKQPGIYAVRAWR